MQWTAWRWLDEALRPVVVGTSISRDYDMDSGHEMIGMLHVELVVY